MQPQQSSQDYTEQEFIDEIESVSKDESLSSEKCFNTECNETINDDNNNWYEDPVDLNDDPMIGGEFQPSQPNLWIYQLSDKLNTEIIQDYCEQQQAQEDDEQENDEEDEDDDDDEQEPQIVHSDHEYALKTTIDKDEKQIDLGFYISLNQMNQNNTSNDTNNNIEQVNITQTSKMEQRKLLQPLKLAIGGMSKAEEEISTPQIIDSVLEMDQDPKNFDLIKFIEDNEVSHCFYVFFINS